MSISKRCLHPFVNYTKKTSIIMKLCGVRFTYSLLRRVTGRRRLCYSMSIAVVTSFTLIFSFYLFFFSNDNDIVDDNVMIVLSDTKYQKEYIDKKGIHVIVGQYVGKSLPWEMITNLSDDVLNSNNYSPVRKAGEMGQPVYVEHSQHQYMKLLYNINRFNLLVSDRISVNRSLPDPRKQSCKNKIYELNGDQINTSIIIVFHNEAWSTLLRTIHSVINRSQRKLLKEVILVDDASTRTFLGEQLQQYTVNLTRTSQVNIKLLRSQQRIGLIKARLIGADAATGKVLTFLDAHCEATVGWLEPLLARISEDPTRVVCPVIDIIHDDTFAFARSFDLHWGGINWNMHFRWFPIGKDEMDKKLLDDDYSIPFRTPIMAGGLFAIDKDYFYKMGAYDMNMDIWGGENIELSLRIWQCGGRIEIVPCSHVAHLFRKSSPYTFPREGGVAGVLYTNLARVVEVWMDEWKAFFYRINPVAKRTIFGNGGDYNSEPVKPFVNISERIELRKKLNCKSFEWFLNNIWPQHFFPTKNRFFGSIKSEHLSECLQKPNSDGGPSSGNVGKVELARCGIELYSPQCFVYTKHGIVMTDDSLCLDVSNAYTSHTVLLLACSGHERQRWKYDQIDSTFVHIETDMCLDVLINKRTLTLKQCDRESTTQRWTLASKQWH